MLKSPLLFAISVLVALLSWTGVAKAAEGSMKPGMELSFALPPVEQATEQTTQKEQPQSSVSDGLLSGELVRIKEPLPPISENPTPETLASEKIQDSTSMVTSEGAVSGENASEQNIGVQFLKDDIQMPSQQSDEQLDEQLDEQAAELPAAIPAKATNAEAINAKAINIESSAKVGAEVNVADLNANLNNVDFTDGSSSLDDWIFEGGSGSLVAHTVGSAEGTRQWNGERTRAYYGHEDPGNGVWNLGTFSYQHEASSPEDADEKQIKRLKVQGFELEEQAAQQGMKLSLIEKLNGLDLANQAPLAALGKGGYIKRLAQAHRLQLQGEEAISWARTQAYMDPDTKLWDAPGLGNNVYSISKDQERRMSAIDKALRAYRQTDERSVALANLEDISLENTELDEPSFDGRAEAFKVSDRPTHQSDTANSNPAKASTDASNLESSSEVTFALPPSAQTGSNTLPEVTPITNSAPSNEEVLASIAPSAVEPSTIPSAITPSTKPIIKPTVKPDALAFGAADSEGLDAAEPEVEPTIRASFSSAELSSAAEESSSQLNSDHTIPLEAKLDINEAAKAEEAKASVEIPANNADQTQADQTQADQAQTDKAQAEEAQAVAAETELSIPVSLTALDRRGDKPAPNRS